MKGLRRSKRRKTRKINRRVKDKIPQPRKQMKTKELGKVKDTVETLATMINLHQMMRRRSTIEKEARTKNLKTRINQPQKFRDQMIKHNERAMRTAMG